MPKITVVICIDGLDPEYLEACQAPNIRELGKRGFLKVGSSMMPSVTNVNNVSLVTAAYPESHGINSNYWLDRETGKETYMESGKYVLAETLFQRAARQGKSSVLITSKDKLRTLIGDGASIAFSSEKPTRDVVEAIGEPPQIYSLEVNGWVIEAASYILSEGPVDVVYIATTDYAMHTYPPDAPRSQEHVSILDNAIGELVDVHPGITLLITADHGMSSKSRMVDLKAELARYGIKAKAVPIIKDRYVVHHSNLGGCMFVYLGQGDPREALKILRETSGVQDALTREEAAAKFKLHYGRLGDFMVNGEKDVVFGDPMEIDIPPGLRSHASIHERRVPLMGFNGDFDSFSFQENRDMGRYVFERILA
ncbi:MAG: alkaline phosphatase family protein [Dehalococcoidia bacterium]